MPQPEVGLALGKIKITLEHIDSGGTVVDTLSYFGLFQDLNVVDSEQLKVYYAPDTSSPTERSRFGALSLRGPGQVKFTGILAATGSYPSGSSYPDQDFTSGLENLTDAAVERKVFNTIELKLDYDFDDSPDKTYPLKDAKISSVNMRVRSMLMSGSLTLAYSYVDI